MKSTGAADVFKIPESPWLPAKITSQGTRTRRNRLYFMLFDSTTKEGKRILSPTIASFPATLFPAGAVSALAADASLMLSVLAGVLS